MFIRHIRYQRIKVNNRRINSKIITPYKYTYICNPSIIAKSSLLETANTFATNMHVFAKGIILFTLFYSSMNWWYYKRIREEHEKKHKDK